MDRIIRRAMEPVEVTPALLDAAREEELAATVSAPPGVQPMLRQMIEDRWSAAVTPETMPAHGNILTGGGRLWVSETDEPGDAVPRWTAFDAEGRMLGTAAMPDNFRATEFGADYVLGVSTDENGVERVELFPLEIPTANP